jgi:hypothetical protein
MRVGQTGVLRRRAATLTLALVAALSVTLTTVPQAFARAGSKASCVRQHRWHAPSKAPKRRGRARRACGEAGNTHPIKQHHAGKGTAQLGGGYDNERIAEVGLSQLGRRIGSCKEAVNAWVATASGGSQRLGGGYYSDYQRAGGVQVSRDAAIKGDIIQLNGPHLDSFYEGMHTAVVVSHSSGSTVFDVVDSNWGWTNTVHHHTFDPYALARAHGLTVHIWRMGTAPAALPPTPGPPPPTAAPPGTFPHHVYHTCANGACGLHLHSSPSLSAPVTGVRNDGDEVFVVCQTSGDQVYGSDGSSSTVWDKLSEGNYAADYYVDTAGTRGAFSPPIPQCAGGQTPVPPSPPPPAAPALSYNCGNGPTFGHYVPAGKHWGNEFIAQNATITGGYLLIGAASDGGNHQASIGIFTGGPYTLSGELGSATVSVSGYGGVSFSFPSPVHVTPGQTLWLVASGIGDFTAYDQNNGGSDGCFIGRLEGS